MAPDERAPLLGRQQDRHFQPTKRDALVKLGSTRVENALVRSGLVDEGGKHDVVLRATALTVFPVAMFNVVILVLWRFYHTRPVISMLACIQALILGAALPQWSKKRGPGGSGGATWNTRWKNVLSGFCVMAAMAGILLFLIVYYRDLVYYRRYHDMRVYSNIAAASPPILVADGGIVGFAAETVVDTSQTIGFYSAEIGERLCMAPIVDPSMEPTDKISFFATGVNCCGSRGLFRCGDALEEKAHSGMLLVPARQLVDEAMEWAVQENQMIPELLRATELHMTTYGSQIAQGVRFLRWTKDPRAERGAYRHAAVVTVLTCDAIFTCLCFIVASVAAVGPRRLERCLESFLVSLGHREGKRSKRGTARGVIV